MKISNKVTAAFVMAGGVFFAVVIGLTLPTLIAVPLNVILGYVVSSSVFAALQGS